MTAITEYPPQPGTLLTWQEWWLSVFREAAQHDVSLIFTFAPERTVSPTFVSETLTAVEAAGGRVRFVALTCPMEEVEWRLASSSRAAFGKLRSRELFRTLQQSGAFTYPPLPDSGLSLDPSQCSPPEAARRIREFFSLQPHES